MNPASHPFYYEESRILSRSRGKLACFFGITLVPIFIGLDFVLVPQLAKTFALLRGINTIENVIIYLFLQYALKLSLRRLNLLVTFYFCSIGIMIAYMCYLMGGFASPYYAGLNIVMLVVGVVMAWHPIFTFLCGAIIYTAYVLLCYQASFRIPELVNSSYFLLSTVFICVIGTIWKEKQRLSEFKLRQELKQLDQAKSSFFANISHELKTPMTLVVSPLENVMRKTPVGFSEVNLPRETFEIVRHNAYRLSGLISDLLDLTKSEIGKARLNPIEIESPADYFKTIFQSLSQLTDEKGIQSELVVEGTPAPHCFDRAKIDKVIVNLISNAIKFTPRGGKITLEVKDIPTQPPLTLRGGGTLQVSVTDTGIGIPEDKLPKIFERFMQVDASSTRAYGGMGIGLSLVKDFVDQHGGEVQVESQVGKGTRFTISLPRGMEHFKATVIEGSATSDIGKGIDLPQEGTTQWADMIRDKKVDDSDVGRNESIIAERSQASDPREMVLVVDDNAEIRKSLREILQEKYWVIAAGDGLEGGEVARKYHPDLIISDVMMPRRDGYGFLADIKADMQFQSTPVILLTSKSGEENISLGFRQGADDYVSKPFQPKELLSRIENMLRMKRQTEEIRQQRDELERLNHELKEAEAELVQTEKLSTIGLLAAGFAHEVNNPAYAITLNLANIENLLEEVRETKSPTPEILEKFKYHLKRSAEEIDRIKKIIKTFLNYSQKNRQGITAQSLSQNIESTLVLLKHMIDETGANVHWDEKGCAVEITADHAALNQVFTNLVQNAIQAGAKNIWIQTEAVNGTCMVKVKDDASGIPADVLPHIFEPFYTTKDVGKGTGLGLNIVQRIIKTHGGQIEVESEVGQGTEFKITIPVHVPEEAKSSPVS